ncbi:Protein NUCLEAR FUSION DEFECTIVE 4 [Linum grandiflorum]
MEAEPSSKSMKEKLKALGSSRWLVFVCSMWLQSCAGIGYMFGSISPVIKTTMGYNQKQLALLGVAKDLGDSIGVVAGSLIEVSPTWVVLLIGAVQNFLGYGLVWLIVTQRLPPLPLWVLCAAIFVGTNGETYFNTADLVSSVQNFPKNRGPVVGILKGFAGLSGAILTQVYAMINSPNQASLIFMVAVGPTMVAIALMFLVRPVEGHKQASQSQSDSSSFSFVYGVCILLAAYLLGILIVNDVVELSQNLITLLTLVLLLIVLAPVIVPVKLVFFSEPRPSIAEHLLSMEGKQVATRHPPERLGSFVLSETEDEESISTSERNKRMAHVQAKLYQAAAEGAVRVKPRKGPRRGEDFTLMQALVKADFLLIWFSLVLAAGSGLTVIDNLGQICQSLGYDDANIYVSMMSIWNFLGRVAGGYFSEVIVRKFAYPRIVAMAAVELTMALGLFYSAMGWPGQIYVVSVVIGLTYGANWAIVPAAVSELFGLKSFGALYNFLNLSTPAGSLVFSGVIASRIYDYYAEEQQQAGLHQQLQENEPLKCMGSICFSLTFGIMGCVCIVAMMLSMIVVRRTKGVYAQLYGNTLA